MEDSNTNDEDSLEIASKTWNRAIDSVSKVQLFIYSFKVFFT